MPDRIVYLDHAASSWPKPQEVVAAVAESFDVYGGNPGRGAYAMALATARVIFNARRDLARLLGVSDSRNLAFVPGCTAGCNLMLKGLLKPGDRVVVSSMEHNAIARPLNFLAEAQVEVEVVRADPTGLVDPDAMEAAVRSKPTKAVVCQHASNVTGTIQPVVDLADIAHANGALLLVDGAQAAGHLLVDLESLGVDAWSASGHKGLLGPQGVGLLYLAPHVDAEELVEGGTGGGASELPHQPKTRPDRYEAGTPNTPGIAGLGAAARLLLERGEAQRAEEARLIRRLHEGLLDVPGLRVLGPELGEPRIPVLSVVHERIPADEIAFTLDRRFGVAVRAGLHCAPWAHQTLGTLESGAVRFGVGYGLTDADIDLVVSAMQETCR